MRALTITAMAAAVLVVGGVVAVISSDFLRATADDVIRPLPSPTASLGPLDPAAKRYLDAVAAKDTDALTDAFAPDALVIDVGREIRGRNAIRPGERGHRRRLHAAGAHPARGRRHHAGPLPTRRRGRLPRQLPLRHLPRTDHQSHFGVRINKITPHRRPLADRDGGDDDDLGDGNKALPAQAAG